MWYHPLAQYKGDGMIQITFNAFSFLREHLKKKQIAHINAPMELPEHYTPNELIEKLGFAEKEVEAVFINGKVCSKETMLRDGDRLALLPPGTPGSYRLMLGIKEVKGD